MKYILQQLGKMVCAIRGKHGKWKRTKDARECLICGTVVKVKHRTVKEA